MLSLPTSHWNLPSENRHAVSGPYNRHEKASEFHVGVIMRQVSILPIPYVTSSPISLDFTQNLLTELAVWKGDGSGGISPSLEGWRLFHVLNLSLSLCVYRYRYTDQQSETLIMFARMYHMILEWPNETNNVEIHIVRNRLFSVWWTLALFVR